MSLLFDSSAIFNVFRAKKTAHLLGGQTIDLASYELGNAVRRLVATERKLTPDEGLVILVSLGDVVGSMGRVQPGASSEVLKLALKEALSYYDASFLEAALRSNRTLVTDDDALHAAARRYGEVLGSADLPEKTSG